MLVERHGGGVPRSFAELESLPGVGHKTASVVLAIAFRMPTFPVDTHIHRRVTMHSLLEGLGPADMRVFAWLCFGAARALLVCPSKCCLVSPPA